MIIKLKSLILIALTLSISSCYNNTIYVDLSSQVIKSCNGKGIRFLTIRSDSLRLHYLILWDLDEKSPSQINLNDIDPGYKITQSGSLGINPRNFRLTSDARYQISNHSNGDAAPDEIKIYFKNNVIKNTSRPACK